VIALAAIILNSAVSAVNLTGLVSLQFGGGFIELAVLFVILVVVAAVVGASGVAGISMPIAKWFVIIFVVLAVVSLVI
jgi:Protein of unknown function (DUF1328).